MRGAGHIIGGILGGLIIDRWFTSIQLMMTINAVMLTASGVWSAYNQSLTVLFFILLLQGCIGTFLNIAGNRIIFNLFSGRSAAPLNFVILGYALGGIFATLLVEQFLDERFSGRYHSMANIISSAEVPALNSTRNISSIDADYLYPKAYYPAKFVIAFWIIAIIGLAATLSSVMLYIHDSKSEMKVCKYYVSATEKTFLESLSPRNYSQSHPYHALALLFLLFFYMACIYSIVRIYAKIIFSYARDGPGLSVASASMMNSSFFMSSAVGLLIFIIPMMVLHIKYIIQVVCMLGISTALYFLYSNITWLWILYIGVGLFCGSIISSGSAMLNRYIDLTAMGQMSSHFGVAFGEVGVMFALSWSYQNFGPYVIWPYLVGITTFMTVVTCAMQVVGWHMGDRFHRNSTVK